MRPRCGPLLKWFIVDGMENGEAVRDRDSDGDGVVDDMFDDVTYGDGGGDGNVVYGVGLFNVECLDFNWLSSFVDDVSSVIDEAGVRID